MDVGRRIDVGGGGASGSRDGFGIEHAVAHRGAGQHRGRALGEGRLLAETEQRDDRAGTVAVVTQGHAGRDSRQREIAVASRHLLERPTRARRRRRNHDLRQHLARLERGREHPV